MYTYGVDRIEQLGKILTGCSHLLIIPHNDPDPDAIAASVGFRYLVAEMYGIDAHIQYHGIIGRAENKAVRWHHLPPDVMMVNKREITCGYQPEFPRGRAQRYRVPIPCRSEQL